MSLLTASNLSKFYGADEIFSGVTLEIPQRARIALVGPNGAGKTTLVNLLIGTELSTDGSIHTARDLEIAFLPQRPELAGDHTLWDEQLKAFESLLQMEHDLAVLGEQMADPDTHDEALAAYGPLQEEFERLGGYGYEARIRMVLNGVGFGEDDYQTPLPQLSGGQRTRAMLGRLLLAEPDLLILDEPTNHLDINAIEWLESFLKGFPGAVLAVSHDRYFIDNFADTVWEMEFGTMETYRGNYTHYLQQRDERRERLQKEYERQQAFIEKEKAYIRKHMGSRWTAQAKGRQKKLDTMRKRGKIIERGPRDRKKMILDIQAADRSGDKVVMTEDLAVGYETPLFQVPDITVWRGETVAIIGPNGAGKSTLLKVLTGEKEPLSGTVIAGASVQPGYFAQAHEKLNPDNSILDEILSVQPMPISEARNYLGKFLFSGEDVFRPVNTLSGGERGRVALAKLALSGANLLLLDEPTNHLDIDSQEILQAVLSAFNGTILLVSHDRYLIDALATQLWLISPGQMTVHEGTYQDYLEERNRRLLREQAEADAASDTTEQSNGQTGSTTSKNDEKKKHGLNPFELKKAIARVEDRIESLEETLETLQDAINAASTAGDAMKVRDLGEDYTHTEAALKIAMQEWETLLE